MVIFIFLILSSIISIFWGFFVSLILKDDFTLEYTVKEGKIRKITKM